MSTGRSVLAKGLSDQTARELGETWPEAPGDDPCHQLIITMGVSKRAPKHTLVYHKPHLPDVCLSHPRRERPGTLVLGYNNRLWHPSMVGVGRAETNLSKQERNFAVGTGVQYDTFWWYEMVRNSPARYR